MLPNPRDRVIKELIVSARTIAVVGLSPKESRPSNSVARYLMACGYTIVPVNPGQHEILGAACYADVASVATRIDIVTIFRKPEDVVPVVDQAITAGAGAVWLQQGIVNQQAAQMARDAGLLCVMDRCLKIEHRRLLG